MTALEKLLFGSTWEFQLTLELSLGLGMGSGHGIMHQTCSVSQRPWNCHRKEEDQQTPAVKGGREKPPNCW